MFVSVSRDDTARLCGGGRLYDHIQCFSLKWAVHYGRGRKWSSELLTELDARPASQGKYKLCF